MNKYFFIVIFTSLIALQSKAQDAVSSDLEEVNVYESLKKSGDVPAEASSSDVKMSPLEVQDDLQSLKEDIGEVAIEKDKEKENEKKTLSTGQEKNKGTLDIVNPKGQTMEAKADEKTEII
ncbi:MAG: hypothetical protein Q7U04_14770, partial [Bacteriovorax sp.]|nr:hypothetical protein [Bacteriovorax sp.]